MAGVAYSHGVHSSEEHGRAKNLGHGVLVVSHASSSCYQTRVRWMARMGGHFGHRALQGKYNERGWRKNCARASSLIPGRAICNNLQQN